MLTEQQVCACLWSLEAHWTWSFSRSDLWPRRIALYVWLELVYTTPRNLVFRGETGTGIYPFRPRFIGY